MSDFLDQYLTTGGVDDEVVSFRNAKFTTDIQYRDGQEPFLCVDIVPESPDVTELTEVRIGLGNGWEASDDEATVSRVDGKKPAFNTSSKAGRLLGSLGKIPEFQKAVEARVADGSMPAPTDAAFWEGIKGTINRNEESFTTREGTEASFSYYTFSTFDGWEGVTAGKVAKKAASKKASSKAAAENPEAEETPAPAPAAKKAAAKKAAAVKAEETETETEAADAGDAGGLDAFRAALVEHCKATEAEDHASWLVEAYTTFGDELVAGGDEFQALVDDEGAVWAEVWG